VEQKPARDPEDSAFLLGISVLALVVGAIVALVAAGQVAAVVGGTLRFVGAILPAAPPPPESACRVIAVGGLLMAASALLVAYKTLAWATGQADSRPGADAAPGPRVWIAVAACFVLCVALGLGMTALFQEASGLPILLSWRAALAGGPLAILVLLAAGFLLAS
jgi:hypothetical protein